MRRIGDRQFLFAWQGIRAATIPAPDCMEWQIGEVICRRYRHNVGTPDHSLGLDVCHLLQPGRSGWKLVICSENWWDDKKEVFRNQLWATHLSGPREPIMSWIRECAATLERRREAVPPHSCG